MLWSTIVRVTDWQDFLQAVVISVRVFPMRFLFLHANQNRSESVGATHADLAILAHVYFSSTSPKPLLTILEIIGTQYPPVSQHK